MTDVSFPEMEPPPSAEYALREVDGALMASIQKLRELARENPEELRKLAMYIGCRTGQDLVGDETDPYVILENLALACDAIIEQ